MSDGTNELGGVAEPYIEEIEEKLDELASLQGSYMASCRAVREQIKGIKDRAVEDGVRRKPLNKIVKQRELERKIAGLADDLEDEDKDQFEMLTKSLSTFGDFGDTPLGRPAKEDLEKEVAKAGGKTGKRGGGKKGAKGSPDLKVVGANTLDDVGEDPRPQFLKDKEATRQDEAAERLAGMKTLDDEAPNTIN